MSENRDLAHLRGGVYEAHRLIPRSQHKLSTVMVFEHVSGAVATNRMAATCLFGGAHGKYRQQAQVEA